MFDNDYMDGTLEGVAKQTAVDNAEKAAIWQNIRADLKSGGPFAQMILSFRASAQEAMIDLAFVDASKTDKIASLQNEIRRYVSTMELIHAYRDEAKAIDANTEAELSDEDHQFLQNTLED